MVVLFNTCFSTGTILEEWSRGIINPILKNPKLDARNPNDYGRFGPPVLFDLHSDWPIGPYLH